MTMRNHGGRTMKMAILVVLFLSLGGAGRLAAQTGTAPAKKAAQATAASAAAPAAEADPNSTQRQLMEYLRMSPKLTSVLERDPELMADQAYVERNNPELEQFLEAHPAVRQNPEFYLFSNLGPGDRGRRLQQVLWPEQIPVQSFSWDNFLPFLVFLCILSTLIWAVRTLMENRRWGRIFKVQTETQAKLLERFDSPQDLLAFLGSEEGRRALELPPISSMTDTGLRAGSPFGRILTSLQIGIPVALVGAGLIYLRGSLADVAEPLLLFGTLGLVLGIGLIVSAGVSFLLARHLGLLPPASRALRQADAG